MSRPLIICDYEHKNIPTRDVTSARVRPENNIFRLPQSFLVDEIFENVTKKTSKDFPWTRYETHFNLRFTQPERRQRKSETPTHLRLLKLDKNFSFRNFASIFLFTINTFLKCLVNQSLRRKMIIWYLSEKLRVIFHAESDFLYSYFRGKIQDLCKLYTLATSKSWIIKLHNRWRARNCERESEVYSIL